VENWNFWTSQKADSFQDDCGAQDSNHAQCTVASEDRETRGIPAHAVLGVGYYRFSTESRRLSLKPLMKVFHR